MLIGGKDFRRNRSWLLAVVLLSLAAVAWYSVAAWQAGGLPGGSSRPGLVFGIAGGTIILFEFLLWPRKKVRAWRIGSAQSWLRAHIWLGLLTVPLILMHARLLFIGGWLNVALMVLFTLVILSGVFGLIMQQFLPRMMLERVPAETIYAQIDHVSRLWCDDAEELVAAVCGGGDHTEATGAEDDDEHQSYGVVAAFRSVSGIQGKTLETRSVMGEVQGAEIVRDEFQRVVRPYVRGQDSGQSRLQSAIEAARFFSTLRSNTPTAAHGLVDTLEQLCEQRRQLEFQGRLHFWLHAWLWLHLPLSIVLLLLMAMHIFVAMKYW